MKPDEMVFRVGDLNPEIAVACEQRLTAELGSARISLDVSRPAILSDVVRVSVPEFEMMAVCTREGVGILREMFDVPREETWTVHRESLDEFMRTHDWVRIEPDNGTSCPDDYVRVTIHTFATEQRRCDR